MMGSRLATGMLLALAAISARADLEAIALKHRSVDEVIPVLRPLVEAGGAISGANSLLVIRASRGNVADLRKAVALIDVAPRRLMISVRDDAGGAADMRDADANAAPGTAARGATGGARAGPKIGMRSFDSRSANESGLVQQIQAIEGSPAFFRTGRSLPAASHGIVLGAAGAAFSDSVSYRDVTAGFDVIPRVVGENVILDIGQYRDSAASAGSINVQRMASTASGRLGEWFALGSAAPDESRRGAGAGTVALRQDLRRVWIKVEEIR